MSQNILESWFRIQGGAIPTWDLIASRVNEAVDNLEIWQSLDFRKLSGAGLFCLFPVAVSSSIASVILYESDILGTLSISLATISWVLFCCNSYWFLKENSERNRVIDSSRYIREFSFSYRHENDLPLFGNTPNLEISQTNSLSLGQSAEIRI